LIVTENGELKEPGIEGDQGSEPDNEQENNDEQNTP
jgi:hypothetical protein